MSSIDFRMRYAKEAWESERDGWRVVVQLNIVRSIIMIIQVVEAELGGDPFPVDEEAESVPLEDGEEGTVEFTDQHRLLMIRLAPLRAVEAELKHRLGAGAEPVPPSASLSATPFGDKYPNPKRQQSEFSVRSWKEVLDRPDRRHPVESGGKELDSVTLTLAQCKDDMRALWEDKNVRSALKRRKLGLHDSAGL